MNQKIIDHLIKTLSDAFNDQIDEHTVIDDLPWTKNSLARFKQDVIATFAVEPSFSGTVLDLSEELDHLYGISFWGSGAWQPRTDIYQYSGWGIVDEINKANPRAVLDVGCGYNQFKPVIKNLVGIDKYNNHADHMVDIMDHDAEPGYYDAAIVFGSINFGTYDDVAMRFKKVFDLTAPGGKIYVRANPGEPYNEGPWIQVFHWDFKSAHSIATSNGVKLLVYKQDRGNRLFLIYQKPSQKAV